MKTPSDVPAALAAATQHHHLSPEERATILNMIVGDRTKAAELLACIAGILCADESDFALSQDLRGAVMDASRFVRKHA